MQSIEPTVTNEEESELLRRAAALARVPVRAHEPHGRRARRSSSCARCTEATATGSWRSCRSDATARWRAAGSQPSPTRLHEARRRLVLRRPHPPSCPPRSRRTSLRAATPRYCTRSPRTTSRTTAARWRRSSPRRTRLGLEVQMCPWGVGRTFGGEAESRWVTFHPEACQVLDDGRRVADRLPQQSGLPRVLQGVGRRRARGRHRLRLLGRAALDRPRARRRRRPERWACCCEVCRELSGLDTVHGSDPGVSVP